MNLLDLTIAIPVLNEQKNIKNCLNAIGTNFAKKIVLIDSGSVDDTSSIAREYGVEFINFKWNGQFPKKRNWYLRNFAPTTKWILFLDADEMLTAEFKNEVSSAIESDEYVGYWLHYSRYFMGKKLKGGYPLDKLALFKVGFGEYEYIDEKSWSNLDMEIHEHPLLNGKIGKIKAEIEHNDFRGIEFYQKKHIQYALWEANRYMMISTNDRDNLTFRQKVKYSLIKSSFGGIIFFFIAYFYFKGFLDGWRGLIFSVFKMNYYTMINAMIKEIEIIKNN